ncbi:MAG: peptidylprolyl isomerase [Gammaproteobacteria bacterium]
MHRSKTLTRHAATALLATSLCCAPLASATVVEFQTVLGSFRVNLFDDTTPQTVANFLDYVNNGAYSDSIVHRSVPDFVIQGGGFTFDGALPFGDIATNDPVVNEPELSNRRGTISMAKVSGQPNSATSQWFINTIDNQGALDGQNGGFTAFGIVMDNGMDVVDAIADLARFNFGGAFTTVPLRDYTDTTVDPDGDNVILITAIVVTDSTTTTNTNLLPPANTIITTTPPTDNGGGSGGGAPALPGLLALGLLALRQRR